MMMMMIRRRKTRKKTSRRMTKRRRKRRRKGKKKEEMKKKDKGRKRKKKKTQKRNRRRKRKKNQELLYCRCDGLDADGEAATAVSRACVAMMGSLRPACSVVELPPPNCADVLQRCLANSDCRFVQLLDLVK